MTGDQLLDEMLKLARENVSNFPRGLIRALDINKVDENVKIFENYSGSKKGDLLKECELNILDGFIQGNLKSGNLFEYYLDFLKTDLLEGADNLDYNTLTVITQDDYDFKKDNNNPE